MQKDFCSQLREALAHLGVKTRFSTNKRAILWETDRTCWAELLTEDPANNVMCIQIYWLTAEERARGVRRQAEILTHPLSDLPKVVGELADAIARDVAAARDER